MVVGEFTQETDLLVIGGGPGGYAAAFRAAELGIQTAIVDSSGSLGGVCLQRGCIPSKALLYVAEILRNAKDAAAMGVTFGKPKIDIDAVRTWKNSVIEKLTTGLDAQCRKYKVEKIAGTARFEDSRHVAIEGGGIARIRFRRAIIATGSRSMELPGIELRSPRLMYSRAALDLEDVPKKLLVVGGGYIGLELGMVYAAFGSAVTVVEMMPTILPGGVDADLIRPLAKRLAEDFEEICLETRVTGIEENKGGLKVSFEGKNVPKTTAYDKVLVSIGRRPNTRELQLDRTRVQVDQRGFITVDDQFQTADPKIRAIGDCIGNPMLAHKAGHEGRVVAELLAGKKSAFDPRSIPAVVFTDPQIAWTGLTADDARAQKMDVAVKKIPWSASGRAVVMGRTEGLTKIIFDKGTQRVLGVAMVGPHAGEMIAEGVLALEMGAVAHDLVATIHPHPTLSETIGEVAMMMEG
ncbi:MAG: dihydrolipoyl dehydrogenase [Phycisphaerales bacterium]|nr:MAG: dihydrolipoyl dehydrogenase [Phycisphaerales bacterium]